MLAVRSLGQAVAGTDLTHVQHFSDAAERYRRMFVEATNHAIETQSAGTGWDLRVGREYWESFPSFRYEFPTIGWALAQHGVAWAVMSGWLLVAGIGVATSHRHLRGAE
jgi:ABC-2 type transport system permease protein